MIVKTNKKQSWRFSKKEQEELKRKYRKFNKLIEKDDVWIKHYKEMRKESKNTLVKHLYFLLKANKHHILGIESLTRFHIIYSEIFRRLLIKKGIATKKEIMDMLNEVYKEDFKRIKSEKISKENKN